jgi:hypothetical protein
MHDTTSEIDGQSTDPLGTLEASTEATEVLVLDVELGMIQQVRKDFFADLATDLEEYAVIAAVHGIHLSLVSCDFNSAVVEDMVMDLVAQFTGQTQELRVRLDLEVPAVIC